VIYVIVVIMLFLEQIKAHEMMLKMKLEPFAVHLRSIIEELQTHDANSIFAFPVPAKEVRNAVPQLICSLIYRLLLIALVQDLRVFCNKSSEK